MIGRRRQPSPHGVDEKEQRTLGIGEVDIGHHPLGPRVPLHEEHCGVQTSVDLMRVAVRGEDKKYDKRYQQKQNPSAP